ncbi:PLD nuclease N-terminal domain-containing protein [Kribbella sp. NPDC023972]|uniref:PLD nuclease N-terminal domain-containing protein n=1 Tax=Kribbella sp. NPDC023972 TaxID=3154795 RepID=UPI0033C15085
MVRFLPFLISLALSVYALFSCIQTPDEDVPHLPKLVWIVLIVFVPFVGPIVWLLMLRTQPGRDRGRRDGVAGPPKPASRPVAPDDDPDFLKSLDRYRDPRTTAKPPAQPPADQPQDPAQPKDSAPPKDQGSKGKGGRAKDKAMDKATDPEPDKPAEETPSESDDGKP